MGISYSFKSGKLSGRNVIRWALTVMLFLACSSFRVNAQEADPLPVDAALRDAVVDSITSRYSNWGRVSISGKLNTDLLPVSATVKIYMEKDKLLLISVAAPLVGEAARIEMDKDKLLIVNKLNKTYSEIEVENIDMVYPGGMSDLQSLILGRVTLMNHGALRKLNASDVDVYDINPQNWVVMPTERLQPQGFSYLYTVSRSNFRLSNFILTDDNQSTGVQCYYNWKSNGAYSIEFEAASGRMKMSGDLSFNAPAWGAQPMERFEISSRYSKVSIFDIMKF